MKKMFVLVLGIILSTTACMPEMVNWGWWKARQDNGGTGRQSLTMDVRDNFGFDWVAAMATTNQTAGWDLVVPAGWKGVANENADIVFNQLAPICPFGGWDGNTCPSRRHMWVQTVPVWEGQQFLTRCYIHWDPNYWQPGNTEWQNTYWHWQVIFHEVAHCFGYPDVAPPTDYVGVLSYYNFWDEAYRTANWWGAHDRAGFLRDGYGI